MMIYVVEETDQEGDTYSIKAFKNHDIAEAFIMTLKFDDRLSEFHDNDMCQYLDDNPLLTYPKKPVFNREFTGRQPYIDAHTRRIAEWQVEHDRVTDYNRSRTENAQRYADSKQDWHKENLLSGQETLPKFGRSSYSISEIELVE